MLLCSRNARPQKGLVGRAQWEHNSRPRCLRQAAARQMERRGVEVSAHGSPRRELSLSEEKIGEDR